MQKKFVVVLVIMLILTWIFPIDKIYAETVEVTGEILTEEISKVLEPAEANDQVENLFLFQNDLVVRGVTSRQDYYFEVPQSRLVAAGSYIELNFGHSPALIQDRSTITVMLDDLPLGSQYLDKSNVQDAKWKLELDGLELSAGFHKLSIVIHMESTDNLCMDQNNPANWLILQKESVVHLRYQPIYEQGDLSWYPSPFLEKGSLTPFNTSIVVPSEPSADELLGLAKLARYYTSIVPNLQYRVYLESDLTEEVLESGHLIWVGSPDSWQGPGAQLLASASKAAGSDRIEAGAVYVEPSIWNDDYDMLLITGAADGLARAVTMMTDQSLYSQLSGNFASAASVKPASAKTVLQGASSNLSTVTLKSLNYNDIVVEGLMVGGARISYLVPAEFDISKGGKLHVYFNHSKALNFAQSQATIKINEIPVASTYLSQESSEFGVLEAEIPTSALQGGYINADISFQFNSTSEACSGSSYIGNWAVIDNDSYFSFTTLPNRDLKLLNLPYPFVTGSAWKDTSILLPSKMTSDELTLFAIVNGLYGGSLNSYEGIRLVTMPEEITGEEPWLSDNLIVISMADKLPLWLTEADQIPVSYADGGWQARIETVKLADSTRSEAGIIQLFPSAFGKARDILMLSATSPSRLHSLGALLLDSKSRELMRGQVLVADSLERMHVFDSEQYEPVRSFWSDATEYLTTDQMPVIQRLLFVGAIVLVLVIFALIVWFISRRRRS
jgi:hypothetical protein